jgi:hypothetical protein
MDNLLRLKLDMVYRDLPMETAEKRHSEATVTPSKPVETQEEPKEEEPKKARRKMVKPIDSTPLKNSVKTK